MGEAIRTAVKAPETKKQNQVSQVQKGNFYQPLSSPVEQILFLQRTIGNQAVQRLMKSGALQAKLRIGAPGDVYEQEADRVAEQVMRMPEPAVQPKPDCPFVKGSSYKEKEEIRQTREVGGETTQGSQAVESRINSLRDGGQPLPESVRAFFEPRFGHDFSEVRVHLGGAAEQSTRDVNANAYTMGHNIVFGTSQYAPGTIDGRRLIAHELTHVVQQRRAGYSPLLDPPASTPEREAAAVAESAASGAQQAQAALGTSVGVARQSVAGAVDSTVEVRTRAVMGTISATGRPLSNAEYEKRNAELKKKMSSLARRGIDDAQNGHDIQQDHMENVRGVAGTLSDWWNDVLPPYIGMWSNAIGLLRRAEALLAAEDLRGAHIYLVKGYESLTDAKQQWSQYMTATIEGAQTTITTLTVIRDGAIALEVGLLTGGSGLVGGGVAGSTLAGVGAGTYVASTMESPLGEATRGTLAEIRNTGVMGNLRLAANGVAGILYGTGEGLTGIAKSFANMFLHPVQFVDDLLRLPSALEALWAHRQELWDHFASLPPEQQAFEVGRLTGQIEAMLIAAETTKAGGAVLSEGMTFTVRVPQWVTQIGEVAALVWVDRAVTINTAAAVPALNAASALSMGGNVMAMANAAEPKGGGSKTPKKKAPAKKAVEEPTGEPEGKGRGKGGERVDPYRKQVEPLEDLPGQAAARRALENQVNDMLGGKATVRTTRIARTEAGLQQAVEATPEGASSVMDIEFQVKTKNGIKFNGDGIEPLSSKTFRFQEHKQIMTIWEDSFYSKDVARPKLKSMLERHLDAMAEMEGTGCKGFVYTTNDRNMFQLLEELIEEVGGRRWLSPKFKPQGLDALP